MVHLHSKGCSCEPVLHYNKWFVSIVSITESVCVTLTDDDDVDGKADGHISERKNLVHVLQVWEVTPFKIKIVIVITGALILVRPAGSESEERVMCCD